MAHTPVLLKEVIEYLDPQPGKFVIDGTVDGGGHTEEILERIGPEGKFLGVDWDAGMITGAKEKFAGVKNAIFMNGNYADLAEILAERGLGKADGLLLDLGFSSEQLGSSGRGFSFSGGSAKEPLLMTYDGNCKPVREILKELSAKELAKIIFELSGEKFAMRAATAIKEKEEYSPIETAGDLAETIREALPSGYERGRIDPATRTFQALRIYANDELGNIAKIISSLGGILEKGGRIVVISFHSLEDKVIKENFKKMSADGRLKILTKKPVAPLAEEVSANPRSRSAKLRAAEII
ncbi:MAG: 16S rRNA (cytosine(1402)-N(4))-methyltransferase RsmH [Patescibacteria group bacterium]